MNTKANTPNPVPVERRSEGFFAAVKDLHSEAANSDPAELEELINRAVAEVRAERRARAKRTA